MMAMKASEQELCAEKSALLCRERLNVEMLVNAINELLSLRAENAQLTEQIERLVDQLTDAQVEAGGWQGSFPEDVQHFLLGDGGAFDHDNE
jgi:predicted nuclease with TOPRIM domain